MLLRQLQKQSHQGVETTLDGTKQAWKQATLSVSTELGLSFSIQQSKFRFSFVLRLIFVVQNNVNICSKHLMCTVGEKDYGIFDGLIKSSGFSWDAETQIVTAQDEV